MNLSYRQLRALLAIAERGSVSSAAAELSTTQPALSRLLSQTERRYGVELFHRLGRGGVQLTEAGRRFSAHATEITRRFDLIYDDFQQLRGELAGKISVAMPESAGHILFVPLIKRFKAHHPQVDLRVMSVSSSDVPHHLFAGNADIGIVTYEQGLMGLKPVPFASEQLHLVGRRNGRREGGEISFREVSEQALLLPSMGSLRVRIDEAFAASRLVPKIIMEVDSQEALLDLIRDGEGVSIMSYAGVHRYVQRGEFVAHRIADPSIQRHYSIVLPNNRPRTLLMRAAETEISRIAAEYRTDARWTLLESWEGGGKAAQ